MNGELRERVHRVLASSPGRAEQTLVLERRMRVYMVLQISELLVLVYAPWWTLKGVSALVFALYRARTFWTIIHERVHRPDVPTTVARVFYDASTVFLVRIWRQAHLRHHAHTNTPRDPDTRLFLWRDLNDVRSGGAGGLRRVVRFAATIAQYPLFNALFVLRSLAMHKRAHIAMFVVIIVVYGVALSLLLPQSSARLNVAANFSAGALYILLTFAPTHSATKGNFDLTGDPLNDAFFATNDVWPRSRAWSSLCGGINLHVEHHLFPHVPFEQLPLIAPIVEDFARERGLPYNAYSPVGIWRQHLAFLWRS